MRRKISNKQRHDSLVQELQSLVKTTRKQGKLLRVAHGSSNSTRTSQQGEYAYIDTNKLCEIIEISTLERYALVEPNVPFDKLVDATLRYGFVPAMVPEFPGITVGGAVQGGSGESSSFKWGTFSETCESYEIILGDGSLITCSPTNHADLFYGTSCSFGSLGIMTLLKIKLIPAKPYVRLRYQTYRSRAKAISSLNPENESIDFVDGISFAPDKTVVMSGSFSDKQPLPIRRFSRFYDEWFFEHAEQIATKHKIYEELIPIKDYLFRYDRGGFWVAKVGFERAPYNRFMRTVLAPMFKTRQLHKLVHGSQYSYVYMAQDLCLPKKNVEQFISFVDENYAIYPLWLCPLKPSAKDQLSCTYIPTEQVINVGVWGAMKPAKADFTERNRLLEHRLAELGGRKVLYAHAYYTESEFWNLYNEASYRKLRKKYNANGAFPDLYMKVHTKPLEGKPSKLRGLRALFVTPYK